MESSLPSTHLFQVVVALVFCEAAGETLFSSYSNVSSTVV